MQGNGLVNSPLPFFIFGADKKLILDRYWVRPLRANGVTNAYWLEAYPKRIEDARIYKKLEIVISADDFLPSSLVKYEPNYDAVKKSLTLRMLSDNTDSSHWRYLPLLPINKPSLIQPLDAGNHLLKAQAKRRHVLHCNIQVTRHAGFFHGCGFLVELPCTQITTATPYSVGNLSGFVDGTPCEQCTNLFAAVTALRVKTPEYFLEG